MYVRDDGFRPLMGLWPLKGEEQEIKIKNLNEFPSPDGVMAFKGRP